MKKKRCDQFYVVYLKRIIDFILSGLFLIIFSPLFLLIGLFIKLDSKGPVFYTQERVGKDKAKFKIYKFRTMLTFEDSYDYEGNLLENYDRITKVGSFLRKTSLDEIPQLINIFLGDMAIVGPRPTLSYQVEKYSVKQAKRLEVRPGLTGLAQINGRNSLSWSEKIEYDLKYLEDLNLGADLRIILKTVPVVFKNEKVEFKKHDAISKHAGNWAKDVGYFKSN